MVSRLNWQNVLILSFIYCMIAAVAESSLAALAAPPSVAFKKQQIQVGHKKIAVEIAETTTQHERGLMFRNHLAKDSGMLFIFKEEQILSFWMKNTFIDLSIAYIGKNKKIIDITDMKATSTLQLSFLSYSSSKPALYALEMNHGWFKKNKIHPGDRLTLLKQ